jgi:hypothetical protein
LRFIDLGATKDFEETLIEGFFLRFELLDINLEEIYIQIAEQSADGLKQPPKIVVD